MSRIVVIGFTASCCTHGEVISQGCARCLVRNDDFKAVATDTAHFIPARCKAPGPVEVFTGGEGNFHTAIGIGGGGGISHLCQWHGGRSGVTRSTA